MTNERDKRIDKLYTGDRRWAYLFVALLWLAVLFVFLTIRSRMDSNVQSAVAIGGSLLLLFNTASILAMLRHYADDKANIYGLDLYYRDQMRR